MPGPSHAGGRNPEPCALNAQPLEHVANRANQYRHIWEARFDVVGNILMTIKEENDD